MRLQLASQIVQDAKAIIGAKAVTLVVGSDECGWDEEREKERMRVQVTTAFPLPSVDCAGVVGS